MVHAMVLTLPAAAWAAARAGHPLGNDHTGVYRAGSRSARRSGYTGTEKTSASSYCAKSFRSALQNTSWNTFARLWIRFESRDHYAPRRMQQGRGDASPPGANLNVGM
jgi:hypothetical protein